MNKVTPDIYVDYDGVLVNFRVGSLQFLDRDWDQHDTKELKDARNRATFGNDQFWQALPPTDDFNQLWNSILSLTVEPRILTAYPYDQNRPTDIDVVGIAKKGKWEWNLKHTFVPAHRFHVVDRIEKKNYATKIVGRFIVPNILIDDTDGNIQEWIQNRGIGILHKDTESTIALVKHYYELIVQDFNK
jgi:hypothetical protein